MHTLSSLSKSLYLVSPWKRFRMHLSNTVNGSLGFQILDDVLIIMSNKMMLNHQTLIAIIIIITASRLLILIAEMTIIVTIIIYLFVVIFALLQRWSLALLLESRLLISITTNNYHFISISIMFTIVSILQTSVPSP